MPPDVRQGARIGESILGRIVLSSSMADFLRSLHARAGERCGSFFVGPHWLGAAAVVWPDKAAVRALTVAAPGGASAGALVGAGARVRAGVRVRVLALNEALHPGLDETYVEMNGFACANPERYPALLDALLAELMNDDSWDEFRVSGLLPDAAAATREIARRHGLMVHLFNVKPTYWVDLDAVRNAHAGDFYASLSANTRQQVRRALRALEKDVGKVVLERASTVAMAREWFLAAGPLHRARWAGGAGAVYGGFDNPHFVGFHTTLIDRSFDDDAIHMWRVRAGERVFAYLYNFFDAGCSYFYLSGVDYTIGEKYKPGIVAHVLAIERYLAEGARKYDFMAGANRYKSSLATHESTQEWLVLQRPRLVLRAEALARRLRSAWRQRRAGRDSATTATGSNAAGE